MGNVFRLESRHIPDVARIERECFSEPWSEKSLEMLTGGTGVGFVAEADGRAVAYGGMICVLDEGQITNIATLGEYRNRGYARSVLDALADHARKRGISCIHLEVRASNAAALHLYESVGFECIGVRRMFYSKPAEDAILMKLVF